MSKRKAKQTFSKVIVRLQPQVVVKLDVLADQEGGTRAEVMRRLLTAAVRNVKTPDDREIQGISVGEWRAWSKLAASRNESVSDLVRSVMGKVAARAVDCNAPS